MKVLYLVATTRKPNRENMSGRINGWTHILNALTIHYGDRIHAAATANYHSPNTEFLTDAALEER